MAKLWLPRDSRVIAAICVTVFLAGGCSTVIGPKLSPDPQLAKGYADHPTLPNAVALAESLRAQYAAKVEDQILLDRVVGLALIGAAGAVAGLGATSGPATPIIGTALGGGALFVADSFLSSKPQQFIYAAGANAVQCALDTMQPMIIAYGYRNRLKTLIDGSAEGQEKALNVKIAEAEQLMAGFSSNALSSIYVRAVAAVQEARTVLEPARKALNALDGSGGILRSSLSSIELQVTNAIIAASPSVNALAESLGMSLPAIGKPLNIPPAPTMASKGLVKLSQADEKPLEKVVQDLEQAVAEIKTIIAAVNERPSADKLKTCNVNLEQAGLKMTIDPAGEISVAPPKGNTPTTVTIRVSGGVLPYGAGWIGRTPPPEQVGLAVESGQGVVTITVKKDAEEAAYGLLIHDAANGSAGTSIRITAASDASAATANAAATSCTKDANTEKVQKFLLANNVTKVIVKGAEKALVADGCYGEVTEAAIRFYLKDVKKLKDDEIPNGRNDLINTMLGLVT